MLEKGLLTEFKVFSDIPQDKLEEIVQLCDILEFKSQEVIFNQDEAAKNLYGVLDGKVELSIMFKEKILKTDIQYEESILSRSEDVERQIVVDIVGPTEVFGWSSMVRPDLLTSTASCSIPTRIFSIRAANLKAMFEQNPALGYVFMEKLAEIISQRLQKRTDKLIEAWGEAFEIDRV